MGSSNGSLQQRQSRCGRCFNTGDSLLDSLSSPGAEGKKGAQFAARGRPDAGSPSKAAKSAAFAFGKNVVLEAPRSAGSPWNKYKGQSGTVKAVKKKGDGFVYTVLFRKKNTSGIMVDEIADTTNRQLEDIPERYLRKAGVVARSSDVKCMNFGGVLRTSRVYALPVFQRRYCWSEQQWRRLWQNIENTKDHPEINNHSIGRLMLYQQPDGTRLILDGQQRFTTLILLLAALRHRLMELGADVSTGELPSICAPGRFLPTLDDREDFRACLAEPQPKGDSALIRAKCLFVDLCSGLNSEACEAMVDATLTRVSMLCFVLDNVDSMQAVFEGMARKAHLSEQLVGTAKDLSSCTVCFAEGDGEKVSVSTHWGPDGERLCADCAVRRPGSEPMTPGTPMAPVDLVRNYVIDHFQGEAAMRRIHTKYWAPIEVKYKNDAKAIEDAFKMFIQGQGQAVLSRWALYSSFIAWWNAGDEPEPEDTESIEAHAEEKLEVLLRGI